MTQSIINDLNVVLSFVEKKLDEVIDPKIQKSEEYQKILLAYGHLSQEICHYKLRKIEEKKRHGNE